MWLMNGFATGTAVAGGGQGLSTPTEPVVKGNSRKGGEWKEKQEVRKLRDKKVMISEEGKDGEKRQANNSKNSREFWATLSLKSPGRTPDRSLLPHGVNGGARTKTSTNTNIKTGS